VGKKVRVNALAPGYVATIMTVKMRERPELFNTWLDVTPMGASSRSVKDRVRGRLLGFYGLELRLAAFCRSTVAIQFDEIPRGDIGYQIDRHVNVISPNVAPSRGP
jgi:NAD(P)-dependent dehydrogenase (short-subunit alcohol dehydrogenase family)